MTAPSSLHSEVLGEYWLTRVIAEGAFARLYEAHLVGPHGFDKRVAIRRVHAELSADEGWVRALCSEAQRLAHLNHPNLVQVVDFEAKAGEVLLALEYVEGMTAGELIARVAARRRRIEPGVALLIAREVLRGLEYVHGALDERGLPLGLLHGGIEPAHVLIGAAGQVKLGDFALRSAAASCGRPGPGAALRPGYCSPEQLQGRPPDRRSDIFCAGILLAELLLTRPLFSAGSNGEVASAVTAGDLSRLRTYGWHLSDAVRHILEAALAVDPRERYRSALEFRADVEAALLESHGPTSSYELVEWLSSLGLIDLPSGVQVVARVVGIESPATRSSYRPTPARQYRLKVPQENVVEGPLTAAALLLRVATGRLPDDVLLARGEDPFQPITAVPELQGLWSRHPYRFRDPCDPGAARSPVELGSLPQHLFSIVLSRRSGLLRAECGDEQHRIYFEEGSPVFASSTQPGTLLGGQLVASGAVSEGAIEAALSRGWRRDEPLGAALVLRGFLSQAALQSALGLQMERRLIALARLRAGQLMFIPGARSAMPGIPLLRGGAALVARAVLHAYSPEELGRILMPLWHRELRLSPRAGELSRALELEGAHLEWIRRLAFGGSPARLVDEAGGEAGPIANCLGALLVGCATGLVIPA